MAQTNTSFALLTLGQWCRSHGIYEIRDVLGKANELAAGAESSDLLAQALEEAAIAADVVVCPAPADKPAAEDPAPAPAEVEETPAPRRTSKKAS